ncbi:LysR family transcriptional regulator [Paenibacillus sp. Soil766]|uniref:LysR family transcriptional regulator n=1 Tax=Paenibacillus sp. Soil766 TaxID=1736404 RepID=UPI00070B78D6|nr:LysR family transcriptional regulator [Paenibacillus sp. Soil766]KRF04516.1 LysR family transcriptional regulator [Paenibacillus sp. Soil766]
MEWQQLEYFQVVATLQHFTRAAEQLSITQPALSRSIAQLEHELGVPLFDRRGRSVLLNPYGHKFLEHTTRILQEMKEAKRDIIVMQNPLLGDISLAFLKSLGISFIPLMVRSYLELHPHVNFHLFQNSTSSMLDQLKRGEVDLCLSSLTDTTPEIIWKPLWTEEMFLFVHHCHRFASQPNVRLQEIADDKFIVHKSGYGSRAIFDAMFASMNKAPIIAFEGEEVVSLLGFVSANLGIALLPEIPGMDMKNLVKLPISDYQSQRTIGLAWIKGKHLPPVVDTFREFLIDYSFKNGNYDNLKKQTYSR